MRKPEHGTTTRKTYEHSATMTVAQVARLLFERPAGLENGVRVRDEDLARAIQGAFTAGRLNYATLEDGGVLVWKPPGEPTRPGDRAHAAKTLHAYRQITGRGLHRGTVEETRAEMVSCLRDLAALAESAGLTWAEIVEEATR